MKKVAIYARVSTDGQTIEQQVDACTKYCNYKGFKITKVFTETGSGKDIIRRPKFQELWDKLRKRTFNGVVVFTIYSFSTIKC